MSAPAETAPYVETVDCVHRDAEGDHEHARDIECDYRWMCGVCWRVLDGEPCPDHAPPLPPGIVRIECDATPPHATFAYAFDGYPPPCPWCQWAAAEKRHEGCEHSHHGRWRSWKLTDRVDYWGGRLGLWAGFGAYGNLCGGPKACHTWFRWSPRWSFLFITTHQWIRFGHVFRHGHRWGLSCQGCDGFGVCDRCSPCTLDDCPIRRAAT